MRPYRAILSARCRMLLQYRAAALAGFATQLVWGLMLVMVYEAFYRSAAAPPPISLEQVISYVWIGQAILMLQPWKVDSDIQEMVQSGAVSYELLRPLDTYSLWFCRALAGRFAPMLLRAVPTFLIAGLFCGLKAPVSLAAGTAFAAALAGAVLLSGAISALMSVSLLWTISGEGLCRILPPLAMFCSGMFVPLPLLPDWLRSAVMLLPFRGIMDTPARIYVGQIAPDGYAGALGHQLLWIAALILLGRGLMSRGLARLVVQGG